MKQPPYSLADAENICKEFQHLAGQPFSSDNINSIDCVVIAPFDQVNRNRFIIYYLLFDDAQVALQQDYMGLLFDVLVIAGGKEAQELHHESIYEWLVKIRSVPCHTIPITRLIPTSALLTCRN